MRSDSAAIRCCFLAALVLLSSPAGTALAAELRLTPLLDSPEDLVRVVPLAQGGAALLDQRGIDVVRPGEARVSVVRASEGQRVVIADGGGFYGIITHRDGPADFAPTKSFELRSMDGALVWSMGATEDVTYAISSTGAVVGLSLNINTPERNSLHFYGAGGVVNATKTIPILTGGKFDADGRVFTAQSATGGIQVFDPIGTPLWAVDDAKMSATTPGGQMTAVLRTGSLRLLRAGISIAEVPIESDFLVRRIAIAPDGSRTAIAGKHEIRVFDSALAPTAVIQSGADAFSWTSIDVAPSNGWILACVARDLGPTTPVDHRHPDGEVRAYDASGALVHRASLRFGAWNIFTPTAILDRSGRAATITTRRSVYRTVLP
jgi:hypothetical protein